MTSTSKTTIIAVSGGSGSGKTTFARMLHHALCEKFGAGFSSILAQDHYYIDQSSKFKSEGDPSVNFDHPSAIDFPLLAKHLESLKGGNGIDVPIYDFVTHSRKKTCNHFSVCPVVIVDGMLLLSQEIIRQRLDYSIYVDAPENIRYQRRLQRDVRERGRTPEGVEKQFKAQVKPMHDEFIEPSKTYASEIISGLNSFDQPIQNLIKKITTL